MHAEKRLPACLHSVAAARAWVSRILDGYPDDVTETVTLCVSKAVTNAIRYSRSSLPREGGNLGEVILRLHNLPGCPLYVEVQDEGPLTPGSRPHVVDGSGPLAEHGRGMWLISTLAKQWTVMSEESATLLSMAFNTMPSTGRAEP